jgi:hypothetical protein
MQIIDFLVGAVLALVRFFLRLLGLMLALVLAIFILGFILIWTLLRLGQAMNRRRSRSTGEAVEAQPLLRRQSGDVQDVQARDLPPERGPDGR